MAKHTAAAAAAAAAAALVSHRHHLTAILLETPYDLITYLRRAAVHHALGYPDLAAGDAYRALLLTDEVSSESFEYHERACEALRQHPPDTTLALTLTLTPILAYTPSTSAAVPANASETCILSDLSPDWARGDPDSPAGEHARLLALASLRSFQVLALSLSECGCLASAHDFCTRGLNLVPGDDTLVATRTKIVAAAARKRPGQTNANADADDAADIATLPDTGRVRREIYPWNDHEPDRFSKTCLEYLNSALRQIAPKCEVQVATLPVLIEGDEAEPGATCRQLGVFANDDIAPGEVVLREYSLLTASNRLKESVCDACSAELPPPSAQQQQQQQLVVSCPECHDAVFCDEFCLEQARTRYHPAVCDIPGGLDAIGKDPDRHEADDALYLLLLARVLAMAAHEDVHPLQVREVRYLWGDFLPSSTLPFSFKHNVANPLHVLESMGVDVYATLARHDLWVLNTLYAKFRGTASARKTDVRRGGAPDVAAVHPFWCLANHDCDPNVEWEWGGRMVLSARKERVAALEAGGRRGGGLKKGDEVLNHYCDTRLPVRERREWARGSLGGFCMCLRCRTEAGES